MTWSFGQKKGSHVASLYKSFLWIEPYCSIGAETIVSSQAMFMALSVNQMVSASTVLSGFSTGTSNRTRSLLSS